MREIINMKKVSCQGPGCSNRRVHYEKPDEPRGIQEFWVAEWIEGPFFCSIECHAYWKGTGNGETVDISGGAGSDESGEADVRSPLILDEGVEVLSD